MKNRFSALAFILLSFIAFALLRCYFSAERKSLNYSVIVTSRMSGLPDNIDELLKDEYGVSEYSAVRGNVRAGVERVVRESCFVKYSWVNYDMSSLTVYIIIENLTGETLPSDSEAAVLINAEGKARSAFYTELLDFPRDAPLGFKKILFARFLPAGNAERIDVFVHYGDDVFEFYGVMLNK